MSHKSDKSNLSQLLMVGTEDNNARPNSTSYFEPDEENYNHNITNDDLDSLGPLPSKWEKAYTDNGEVYFIDHSTGTSHWLDPRLSKFQKKSLEDCLDDELPYGWEKISDPHYGTYFIDHVNRRTQYENPVLQAKRAAAEASVRNNRTSFTKDPTELCGQRFCTSLIKSSRGLGITIIGGDDGVDEFLQIKSIVPKGPAWLDGQLQTGDVIVYVNDTCVLGYTHNQIVRLFQSISVGSTVTLEVCRGYPLPFDPNDPNTEVVTTIAVDDHLQSIGPEKGLANLDTNYNFLEGDENNQQDAGDNIEDLLKGMNNLAVNKLEVRVRIVKGNLGFGFTIADSACGQRVKKILDRQRCKNLMEGDILLEINDINLRSMSHDDVVQVLKNCPYNGDATICVQRGAGSKITNAKNKPRKLDNRFANRDISNAYRSKTPTADIYSTQQREVLPSRPKTPLVDTRSSSKTPIKELNPNNDLFKCNYTNDHYNQDLRLSLIDNADVEEELDLTENRLHNNPVDYLMGTDSKYSYHIPVLHRYDCVCFDCHNCRTNAIENGNNYDANNISKGPTQEWWPITQHTSDYIEAAVTLNRQETGFGFRIVGGIEDRSQVAVGHIVARGAADLDGRIRSGDEIVSVDGYSVLKASHRQVVQLMNAAATRGQVNLVLRRRTYPTINGSYAPGMGNLNVSDYSSNVGYSTLPHQTQTYDVVVNRNENEGFGFVIISSVNKVGSTIGRLIEDSPAETCGRLRVGDYIVAVNHIDIMNLSHGDIVNLIKESGLSVTLTIAPNPDL
ncbi:hypothetical protein RN001_016271 [Aquatica leii]|uniref:Uncharacterized protein n=1 Tax=Aquatica leii TaxID=1421715 RepID=A0AAN7SBB2_9COLE|nr:hypothetical protein RN001_016271 [Aquatica leii]